ncbi:MAG: hypothetical protein AAFO82_11050, partial [Bacteroidota bacterium]
MSFVYLVNFSLLGQTPFTCEGQVWIIDDDNTLMQMSVNNSIVTSIVKSDIGVEIAAMGFSKIDKMLYGMNPVTHTLYRIDANGNAQKIATPNMDANLFYLAGDVTTDGRNFVVIGSDSDGMDSKLFTIDLMSGNFEVTQISFEKGTRTVDIGFHPLTSLMYGFDALERRFYTHTLGNTAIALKAPIFTEYNVKGMYFEAFGNMFGLGTALFGSISGLFEVDQTTGATKLISTSGLIPIADMAACPYSFEMNSKIIPEVFFPCSDLLFEYAFANQTGELLKDVLLEHEL